MSAWITCLPCNGTGSANNPPIFHDEGKTSEVSTNCDICKGEGRIEVNNPEGVRVAVLVAKKICASYPEFRWEEVYQIIVANISDAVSGAISSSIWANQPIENSSFDDDVVFSEEPLLIDTTLEKWIEKGNYVEYAKTLLSIK